MLERFGIEVAAHGPSLDDADTYYLVRCFGSAAERNERLDAYGSEEWRRRHRERVLALIDSFHVLLLPAAPAAGAAA
jgi:hypothetical protein